MRDLNIAYGNSCTAKKWSNKTISFDGLCERLEKTIRTTETVEEYQKMKRADREAAKDKGGFVGGQLKGGRRKRENVVSRSMLTMDVDKGEAGFIDSYEMLSPYTSALYTTHGHMPSSPRFRIIVPLTRDVSPDEYQAIARYFAAEWGIDQFDECSYRPHQLMYWPTTPANGEFVCKKVEGEWLDPDIFLSSHPNWRDCSLLPTSSRESEVKESNGKKLEDPESKDGVVGLFCRAYPIREAIETFLSGVYEPSANIPGRYSYIPADSSAGVQIFEEKFAHSFHASDPACGRSLNSFDLVRVHKFGDEDEKKSFQAMCDFAMGLDKVKVLAAEEKKAEAKMDFDEGEDWREKLRYMPRSKVLENSVFNEVLILNNDPDFQNFAFNEMANRIQITGEVPWSRPDDNKFWRDADTAQLKTLLDTRYTTFSTRNHDVAFLKVADDRRFHPVRDYLDGLPAWDGVKRVDTLLIDYFDADDKPYVRAVTRKMLVAAVTRIYHPGTKFDSVPVLDGVQGIGKSTFLKDLCGEEYYADNLSLTDMNDKSAAEKLQGFWIVEIPELAGMKKADIEKVKAFITTTDDKYRPSYGRTVESHPRQCVVIASVNGERGYLRDITGNRRFWVVKLKQTEQKRKWNFSQEAYNAAIQQKSIAQQNADRQKIENAAAIAKAEADKQVAITNAEAEAQKTAIKAEAQAEANKKIAESLSDTLIEYQKIQKWDGKLPTVTGSTALVGIDAAE